MKHTGRTVLTTAFLMLVAFMLILIVSLMTGCAPMTPPRQHSLVVASSYDHTYICALKSMIAIGAVDIRSDKAAGMVSGTVHGAVALTASLTPTDTEGSHVDVTGTILPNKIVVGKMNEVEQYVARVQECY